MEEHYTHECHIPFFFFGRSVIFLTITFGGIHHFGPPDQLTKAQGTKPKGKKTTGRDCV